MIFRYRGVTRNWEEVNGSVEAGNEAEARLRIQSMKVRPLSVRPASAQDTLGGQLLSGAFATRVELKALIIFTRQLASLVDSGVSLVAALEVIAEQERRKGFKSVIRNIKEAIEGGAGFSESLAKYPAIFSDFYVRVVQAGEVSGTLDKSLARISLQLDKLNQVKRKVIRALTYPAITMVIATLVILFLLWKVVPEITKLYGKSDLPELTVMVIGTSKWVEANILFVILGIIGGAIASLVLYKLPSVKRVVDPVLLRIPVLGSLLLRAGVATFSRTLSTLVASGVPLLSAFDICERVTQNDALKKSIRDAVQAVTEGKTISSGLGHRRLFPPMMLHMVAIGEMTGKLDELLEKVAQIYDEEVDDAVTMMTTLLQPALIVVVGAIISVLMVAMYLPIFGMSEKLSGR